MTSRPMATLYAARPYGRPFSDVAPPGVLYTYYAVFPIPGDDRSCASRAPGHQRGNDEVPQFARTFISEINWQ